MKHPDHELPSCKFCDKAAPLLLPRATDTAVCVDHYPLPGEEEKEEDTRNVIDHFKYWKTEAIVAALDERRHGMGIAMWHVNYDINIGSIVRSANAFNAKKMFYIGKRQWDRRGAVGTHHYIHMEHVLEYEDIEWDGPIVAVEDHPGAQDINSFEWPENPLIMVGQESSDGIPSSVLDSCDDVVYIPQYGSVRSLNVACAAGIAMNSWASMHGKPLPKDK